MPTLQVHCRGFALTAALANQCEQSIAKAIAWSQRRIREAEVFLYDINGPHGGVDKSCRVVVRLAHGPAVVVETIHDDLYIAIRKAARQVQQVLRQRFSREQDSRWMQ